MVLLAPIRIPMVLLTPTPILMGLGPSVTSRSVLLNLKRVRMMKMKGKIRTTALLLFPQVLRLLVLLLSHLPPGLPLGSPLEHLRALLSVLLPPVALPVVLSALTRSAPTLSVRTPSDPTLSDLTRLARTPSALALVLLPLELLLELPPASPLAPPRLLPPALPLHSPRPPLLLRTKRSWGSLQRVKCKQYNGHFPLLC